MPEVARFTRYGQYCGPGPDLGQWDSEDQYPKPANPVDNICKSHDIAYYKCRLKNQGGKSRQGLPGLGTACTPLIEL